MKNIRINKILTLCMVSISFVAILVIQAIALEVETHKEINSYIADENSVVYGSYLNNYLKSNLGIEDGVKATFNSKVIKEWISDGGVYEDNPSGCVPYWRSRNHFHNPINNSGFSGWWDTGIISGMSAIDWINQPINTQSCGYYSWNDARKYYYAALTATDKATRETNFAGTFRALGQSMHLVQDMSVPEHTRNDGHYFFYDYEVWAKGLKVSDFSPKPFTPNDAFPLSINNLFDTNQYNGTNSDITTQAAIGLAEYSNANFLSPEHIFTGFNYPAYIGMTAKIETDPVTGKKKVYLSKTGNGENIDYLARTNSFFNYLPMDYKRYGLTLDDKKVYNNYAQLLIPRAIGYSSQVLSYFFRGQLEVEMSEGNLKVKNASSGTISSGTFELYYDNAKGERNLLTSAMANTLTSSSDPQIITFAAPSDGAASYMLVYKGKLGNEPNAVIGKFIPANAEFVVFTVSLNGIAGESLTKKSVLVWNPAENGLARAPIDNADTDFQKWYQCKTIIGDPMFSSFNWDQPPHKLAPELIDVEYMDYHASSASPYNIFPETFYASVLLPQTSSPGMTIYTGLRTSKKSSADNTRYIAVIMVSWTVWGPYYDHTDGTGNHPDVIEDVNVLEDVDVTGWTNWQGGDAEAIARAKYPADYHNHPDGGERVTSTLYMGTKVIRSGTDDYTFLGPLGEFASFVDNYSSLNWLEWNQGSISEHIIPPWYPRTDPTWTEEKNYAHGRYWYSSNLEGRYSLQSIINICVIQYTPCDHTSTQAEIYGPIVELWAFGSRVIAVEAQALSTKEGSTGYNWVARGRNTELETQIKDAIEMAYTLNGIPTNEIRKTSINIEIVK